MYLGVVLNPFARRNRGTSAARRARIAALLGTHGVVVETPSFAALREAATRLAPRVTHFASDGGDGALHWLIHEVRAALGDADPERWPVFVPTRSGTIDFVARKARLRGRPDAILRALARAAAADVPPPVVRLATLRVTGVADDGTAFDRIGFALAAGGIGARFFDAYDADPAPGAGAIARVIGRAVAGLALHATGAGPSDRTRTAARLFAPTRASVVIDGVELPCRRHGAIHAGAIDVNLGGLLRVFPLARAPGLLHFQAGEIAPLAMIANLPALATGGTIRAPGLRDVAGTCMEVEAEGPPLAPVIDGERFEGLRRITVRPGPRIRVARLRA